MNNLNKKIIFFFSSCYCRKLNFLDGDKNMNHHTDKKFWLRNMYKS